MKIYLKICGCLILIVTGLSGCASSLVYSPSMQLPVQPLKKEQAQAGIGLVLLPETRPSLAEQKNTLGSEAFLRYGFSNKVSAQLRFWNDLREYQGHFRGGFSGSCTYMFGDSTNQTRYGLTVAAGTILDNSSLEGFGVSIINSVWLPEITADVRPYTSFGLIIGSRLNSSIKEYGGGILLQGGFAWNLSQIWTVNLEGSFIGQANFYEDISHGIPSLSLASTITF